jgi:PIN domain nuclease of toxin-antitoxin system
MREPRRVSNHVANLIRSEGSKVFVSAASAWEIAIKVRRGKLRFDIDFLKDFDANIGYSGFHPLPMSAAHGVAAEELPGSNQDPFDRMIAGQATVEGLTVATRDVGFAGFKVPTVW